jgi:aldose 1-epimerase
VAAGSWAQGYKAERIRVDGFEVIRLEDPSRKAVVSVVPSIGNNAYEFTVNGKNLFWAPFETLSEWRSKPVLCGNPLLAPWANRLDQDAFYANGKRYVLNPELGNLRRDANRKPIHGLLAFAPYWKVAALEADSRRAAVSSRLEFWRYPDLMAQFPFAHTLTMTYRLQDGALEVETVLENHATEPMPVAVGYHPYFRLHDAPRDEWKVRVAARERWVLSELLIPTGERRPAGVPEPVSLRDAVLDDVFGDLVRDREGRATFWVQGARQKISVVYGPQYTVAVVYAPKGRDFICFEPMTAVTNGLNLAQEGKYAQLQTIAPGGQWRESFWIRPEGF